MATQTTSITTALLSLGSGSGSSKLHVSAEPSTTFSVPTIDVSPYLHDPSSQAAQAVVDAVRDACRTSGFFQIVGHGISAELQQAVFDGAKDFFGLPYDTKKTLDAKTTKGHRGYDVLASQSYAAGLAPDLKEGFYAGHDLPDDHPWVQSGRFFMGKNVWPLEEVLDRSRFRIPVEQYHAALRSLSESVMRLVADTLPYGPRVFDKFVNGDVVAIMRVLHYPPAPVVGADDNGRPQFGSSAHTDFGAITLLLQDHQPGLEVRDKHGVWHGVTPNRDAYVVNVGDMLSKWTGEEYVSSVHRVLNKNKADRYSIVFFYDGHPDAELRRLDGSEAHVPADEVLTVEKHLLRRMKESYGAEKDKGSGV